MKAQGIRLGCEDLQDFAALLFEQRGMSLADAKTVARVLVWADLRGAATHGVSRIPHYVGMIDKGALKPGAIPKLTVDFGALFSLDAQGAAGAVAMMRALDEAQTRARAHGVSLGIVGRATHSGAIGCYAEAAARQGFAAIVIAAGPPLMAYHGARVASLSTAPLAMAVPGGPDGAIVLDMAASNVSNGRLKQAKRDGETLPPGWALDADGKPATDADSAQVLLPMGGAKGSGFALLTEMLTSLLAAAPILAPMITTGKKGHGQNALMILIDISRLRAPDDYASDIDALVRAVKSLPMVEGIESLRLPGERGAHEARVRETDGILIARKVWDELTALAGSCGIEVPKPM